MELNLKLQIATVPIQPKLILINGRKIRTKGRIIYLIVSARHTTGHIYNGVPTGTNPPKKLFTFLSIRPKKRHINLLNTTTNKKTTNK